MFIRPPWNVATPGTFSTPEKNVINDEKTSKKKKTDEKKKSSKELSRMVNRINNTHSTSSANASNSASARSSKADVLPQYSSHNYDLSRLHDDLCDQFGAEDPGAPREWSVHLFFSSSLPCLPSFFSFFFFCSSATYFLIFFLVLFYALFLSLITLPSPSPLPSSYSHVSSFRSFLLEYDTIHCYSHEHQTATQHFFLYNRFFHGVITIMYRFTNLVNTTEFNQF